MKVTIIYDNEVFKKGLKADWGFSTLIEMENTPKILFDTGANGSILLSNMEKLNIDPKTISIVFISHYHWDHIDGLPEFLEANSNVKLYLPGSVRKRNKFKAKESIPVESPTEIYKDIFSTGALGGMEQSMGIKTDKGIAVIAGCSHPGVGNILESISQYGKIYALIGGLHGFSDFGLVKDLDLICPTHCTQYISRIKKLYPKKYIEGGAGRILELS